MDAHILCRLSVAKECAAAQLNALSNFYSQNKHQHSAAVVLVSGLSKETGRETKGGIPLVPSGRIQSAQSAALFFLFSFFLSESGNIPLNLINAGLFHAAVGAARCSAPQGKYSLLSLQCSC